MRELRLAAGLLLLAVPALAQMAQTPAEHDITTYPLVVQMPDMARVQVTTDRVYKRTPERELQFDLYLPASWRKGQALPVIVFVNGVGDPPHGRLKDWRVYTDWGRYAAANGFAAICHDARGPQIDEDIRDLFVHVRDNAAALGVDAARIGAWSCSGNVRPAMPFAMSPQGALVKAAVVYYGGADLATVRTDLPVLAIRSGRDMPALNAQMADMTAKALAANAPWTVVNAREMPHAFDGLVDSNESRRLIEETIVFFDRHLRPKPERTVPVTPAQRALTHIYAREWNEAAAAYREIVTRNPQDSTAQLRLGTSLLATGKVQEAAEPLARADKAGLVDGRTLFNMACGYALAGRREEAFDALERAVARGWTNAEHTAVDTDLESLRADPRFAALLEEMRAGAAARP